MEEQEEKRKTHKTSHFERSGALGRANVPHSHQSIIASTRLFFVFETGVD
jgi:hypothetical protein